VEESEIVQLARFTTRALSACLYLLCQPSVAIKGTVLKRCALQLGEGAWPWDHHRRSDWRRAFTMPEARHEP